MPLAAARFTAVSCMSAEQQWRLREPATRQRPARRRRGGPADADNRAGLDDLDAGRQRLDLRPAGLAGHSGGSVMALAVEQLQSETAIMIRALVDREARDDRRWR